MNVLMVVCHPAADSFTRAVAARAQAGLRRAGHTVTVTDLDAEAFDPAMAADEWDGRNDLARLPSALAGYTERLSQAEGLVLVYPTWWSGPPARLKGWIDRVWRTDVAFTPKPGGFLAPKLSRLRWLVVLTSAAAPQWATRLVLGDPNRRAVRALVLACARPARLIWRCFHRAEVRSRAAREAHLAAVERLASRLR